MNSQSCDHLCESGAIAREQLLVGLLQYKGDRAAYQQSCNRLLDVINTAGQQGVNLLVVPECACSEYNFESREEALMVSELLDGEFADRIHSLATDHQMWCFVGVIEKTKDERLFNSAFIFSPDGSRYCYRKRLLFDADYIWSESGDLNPVELPAELQLGRYHLSPLESDPSPPYPLFNVFGWRTTVGICMDLNDSRFIRFCERAAVDLIAFPTNWIDEGHDVLSYWAYLIQGMERATLLAANSYGTDGSYVLSGRSAILQASPPTLYGIAPSDGDYLITCTLDYSTLPNLPFEEEPI